MPSARLLFRFLAAALLSACVHASGGSPGQASGDASGVPDAVSDTATITPSAPWALMLFEVESNVQGRVRAGEPIRIVTEVQARLPVDTAEIAVVMPEVAAARASGWAEEFEHFPVGVRYPAVDSAITPMHRERPVRLETTVTIPRPGYYQVVVSARVRTLDPEVRSSTPLQDVAHRSFWLWVDETGGYVTQEYDPTRLPLGADPQPGPLRYPERLSRWREMLETARQNPKSHAVVEGIVHTPTGAPARNVTVHVRGYVAQCSGRAAAEEVTRTDATGHFRVRLRSYQPTAFKGCVAVHADPPAEAGWGHVALRDTVRFQLANASPDSLQVDLRLEPR